MPNGTLQLLWPKHVGADAVRDAFPPDSYCSAAETMSNGKINVFFRSSAVSAAAAADGVLELSFGKFVAEM